MTIVLKLDVAIPPGRRLLASTAVKPEQDVHCYPYQREDRCRDVRGTPVGLIHATVDDAPSRSANAHSLPRSVPLHCFLHNNQNGVLAPVTSR